MEKKSFQEEYKKIEVPKEDVLKAIQTGVRRVNSTETPKRNKKRLKAYMLSAATIFIASSLIFPSMSQVMAEVPLLGKVYMNFNDLVGRNLATQQLITELNQKSSSKGIDVSITSAYYDGAVIGVTFNVEGNVKTEKNGQLKGFYAIFKGLEGMVENKEFVYMDPSEKGYLGHIQLTYPKSELPSDTTFPLEFKSIGEKEGDWKFDIPIKQLAFETIKANEESRNIGANVMVHFDSVMIGKASTAINYTATFPSEGKNDQVRLEVYNDKGKEIPWLSNGSIGVETTISEQQITEKGRLILPDSLNEKTSYIEIRPNVALYEKNQFVKLDQKLPIDLKSHRQNLAVTVEKTTLKEDEFIVDFQVNHGDMRNRNFMFFKDIAKNDITLVRESEKEINEKPMKHSTKVVKKEELRFRSTFDLSTVSEFNKDDYIIKVNLNTLSSNIPIDLESVKIDLK